MSKLVRWAAAGLALLCLLLSASFTALWVRSYWRGDALYHARGGPVVYTAYSGGGGLLLVRSVQPHESNAETDLTLGKPNPKYPTILHEDWPLARFGFEYATGVASPTPSKYINVSLPTWSLAVLLAAPGGVYVARAVRRRRRDRRLAEHRCVACGYDVRASADRCPECGAAVPSPAVAV